ncbi:MAG: di-trans,poly-cis-decaprenylcistransferase [Acidobacteriaceae bacterium]|nr:di-trans,poly-cis-decaprenylcistransferase [Acidobacteriaceae bacterium]MBV9227366.1 di-trans,poly-cis-decaprenylcistransferase [Acidobacteriaceae bacterium]
MTHGNLHAAMIMDGNGRWAQRRGLPRLAGHAEGERALRKIVQAAPDCDIGTLTVYAFSSDNWKRPAVEVNGLMLLLETHLTKSLDLCRSEGVKLSVIGRRDRIRATALEAIERAEQETSAGLRLHLRIAIDYSSRDALVSAWQQNMKTPDRAALSASLNSPDVDLLIRTGGEQRLSDFLLWECAYAELFFTPCLWPDFGPEELRSVMEEFRRRDRRYGGLSGSSLQGPPSAVGRIQ